jgi:Protein of unknown function (DUF3618)
MDSSRDRTPPVDGVAEIRADIEAARTRMAETLAALRFKADLPARLGDSVGNAAVSFTEHIIDRVTAQDAETEDQDRVASPTSNESSGPHVTDEPSHSLSSIAKP